MSILQEDELDDLASQVQMLEQSKAKLEMSMTALKKEHRRELGMKDDELEDARQVWPLSFFISVCFKYH